MTLEMVEQTIFRNTAPFSFVRTPVLLIYFMKLNVLQLHAIFIYVTLFSFFSLSIA